jgi:hypothetical protein
MQAAQVELHNAQREVENRQNELLAASASLQAQNDQRVADLRSQVERDKGNHKERLDQHEAKLDEHQKKHDEIHQRVGAVENTNVEHKVRLGTLEQKHKETLKGLKEVESKNKWLVPALGGTAIVAGIAALWFLGSKIFGGKGEKNKEGDDIDTDDETDAEDPGRRAHSRAWRVAPELRSGRHAGKYSEETKTRSYFMT